MSTVRYIRKMTRKDGKAKATVKSSTKIITEPTNTKATFSKSVVPNAPQGAKTSSHFYVRISKVD